MSMAIPALPDPAGYAHEHLRYEAQMFAEARNALPREGAKGFRYNLLVEGTVLHFRNLCDFFYPPVKFNGDDVTAKDYVPSWGNPDLPESLNGARIRANKELAHLTTRRRADLSDKSWDRELQELTIALRPVIEDFIERVSSTQIKLSADTIAALRSV
jgi:hypothetical protein